MQAVLFTRRRHRDLAFEIEVVLAADHQPAIEAMGRRAQDCKSHIAAHR